MQPQPAEPSTDYQHAAVYLRGVSVVRGGNRLLDGIDLDVEEGDRWVVLGPNGAGKTTLLQVLAARLHPTTGTVGLLGQRLGAVDVFELRPRIGLSSAILADAIPPQEVVRDVVVTASYAVVGRWREIYEEVDEERARDLLDALGVSHLADRRFVTLSEGERKRVQIARSLMTDPELMLLDEPAAGLDLGGREDLVTRLGRLAADLDSPAMVVVTHHVEEIPPSFTHALLLRSGASSRAVRSRRRSPRRRCPRRSGCRCADAVRRSLRRPRRLDLIVSRC